jgi:hypothetical protein
VLISSGSFPYPLDGNAAIRLAKTLCCGVLTQGERHCVTMRSKAGMSWVFPSRRGSLSRVAASEDALRAAREPDAPATPIERRVWPLHPDLRADHVRSPQTDRGELQAFRTPLTWASSIFRPALDKEAGCAGEADFRDFSILPKTAANARQPKCGGGSPPSSSTHGVARAGAAPTVTEADRTGAVPAGIAIGSSYAPREGRAGRDSVAHQRGFARTDER